MSLRALAWMVPLSCVAGWWFVHDAPPGFPLDDAWVHLVYARSTAAGDFMAFNPGQPQGGVTAPLWTLLCAVVEWLSIQTDGAFSPATGVRWLGGLMGLLAAWAGLVVCGRAGRWPAVFAGLALTLDPLCNFSRFSGMELPLFGLLSILLVAAVLDGRAARAGLLCGLLLLTRPEALVFVLPALLLVRRRVQRRGGGVLAFCLPLLLCVGPWMAWCHHVTGRPFPDTFVMKAGFAFDLPLIGAALVALVRDTGWGWSLVLLALVGMATLNGGERPLGTLMGLGGLLLVLAVACTRPLKLSTGEPPTVPFVDQRYALLAWPLLVAVGASGLAAVVRTGWAGLRCRPRAAVALLSPLALMFICGLRFLPAHTETLRVRFADQVAQVDDQNVAAGRWIDAHLPADAVVATHDAGAVTYFAHREVLDFWGNNNTALADHIWRDDYGGAAALVSGWRPDALVVFPLQFAVGQAEPELTALRTRWARQPERFAELLAYIQATGDSLATGFGLTRRAHTFHVPRSVTVDSPIHEDLVVFVRP